MAAWIESVSRRTGVPQGQIVRAQLERARTEDKCRPFMRLAGTVRGPCDLSTRKGFGRT